MILKTPFKQPPPPPQPTNQHTHPCLPLGAVYDSSLYFLCKNGVPYPSSLSLSPCLPPFFSRTALIKRGFLWELLWSVVPNAKFSSLSLLFIPTQSTRAIFSPPSLSLSLTPTSFLNPTSLNFFFFYIHRFLQEIVPGWVEEVGVTGWLWGRSMICACVCLSCVCVSQGFSVVL